MRLTKTDEARKILYYIDSVWVMTFNEGRQTKYLITVYSDIGKRDRKKVFEALRLFKEDGALVELEWFDLATEPREWLEF